MGLLNACGDFDADRALAYLSDETVGEGWGSPDSLRRAEVAGPSRR
jgi:hypothetical protein